MNEFISVYDVLLDIYKDKYTGLKELATAVEDTNIPMRCLDQLGRYITADESEDRKPIIAAIISLSKRFADYDAEDVDEYTFHFEADSSNNLLCRYGWEAKSLPDFTAIHKAFLGQKEKKLPKASAKVYGMIAGYLKLHLSPSDYLDFSGGYAPGNKAARAALKALLTQVNETISPKPLSDTLDHTRAFAIMAIKEAKKEL
tara:strand:- start:1681 stop:2283 length:603 start_codon:yes stop_codon:yes gene_type:complete